MKAQRCLVCGAHAFDYVFTCEAFGRYFLLLLALVQIAEMVSAGGIGGGSNWSSKRSSFLRPFAP